MARRFSRIKNGQVYNDALTRYKTWLNESTTRRNAGVGTGQARPPSLIKAVRPFGYPTDTGETIEIRISQPASTIASTAIASRVLEPDTDTIAVRGFKPAKAILFVGNGNGVAETSEITGLKYLKYNGTSYTIPFGQGATATEREYAAYQDLRDTLLTGQTNRRVSYQAETVKQR